jgi:5'(3')-deoxyribonucleotidase
MKKLLENWRHYLTEEAPRKINIFLDMDGVLVDFPTAASKYIRDNYFLDAADMFPNSKSSRVLHRKLQRLKLSDEGLQKLYDEAAAKFQSGKEYNYEEKLMSDYIFKILTDNKELWLSMEKLIGADELVATVFKLADEVFVLTAQVDEVSKVAKKEWIANHFPEINPKHVNVDRDKGGRLKRLISAGIVGDNDFNILIDDRTHFLNSFINAGGIGIKYDFKSPRSAIEELERIIAN